MKKISKILFATVLSILCLATMHNTTAQTCDPTLVQVINNLIANNGLQATPDAPEEWENTGIITWDTEEWNGALSINLQNKGLTGYASFAGLNISAPYLINCSNNNLIGLDITNCTSLISLNCSHNNLTELDLTKCVMLSELDCSYNNLTELVLNGNGYYEDVKCNDNKLTKLIIENSFVYALNCDNNCLTEIPHNEYGVFVGFLSAKGQQVALTLHKNSRRTYSRTIPLVNPTFSNPAIKYENGVLKSSNATIISTGFGISYGEYDKLSGTMNFTYSEEPETGINLSNIEKLKIYLNPANNMLIVECEESIPLTTTVYDMLGKKVLTHSSQGSAEINTSHLQNGVYIVTAVSEGKIIGSTKIIKL